MPINITHKYTIVCDEVRTEDNGKLIVLGMYNGGSILVPRLPFQLPSLTFLMVLESEGEGRWPLTLKLTHLETGTVIADGHGSAQFLKPGTASVPIKLAPLKFTKEGAYDFFVQLNGLDQPVITQISVNFNPKVIQ